MAYGFSAINTSGKLIISDEMENLHFIGKATLTGNDGGAYSSFPSYSGSNDALDGRVIFNYTITTTGTPLVFIKPQDYDRWCCLLTQSVSGNNWTFKVMVGSTSTADAPEVFCFVNANDTIASSETHGLVVKKADGITRTFDSRHHPLAITGGGTITPYFDATNSPFLPTTTSGHPWNYSTNDHDFRSNDLTPSTYVANISRDNIMFSAPSLSQAVYKRQMHGYKRSCGFFSCQDHQSTALWWVMYHQAFRLKETAYGSGKKLHFLSGWVNLAAGYTFSSSHEGGGWFGGGGGSYSTGTMPYEPKIINHVPVTYLIADASRYE